MNKFKLSDVFATMIITGSIQGFTTTEGAEFDIMALTKELKDDVELCESYEDMVALAANAGLSCDGSRAMDNEYLAEKIDLVWEDSRLDECDPCSKTQVGIKVCEISGLAEIIEAQLEKEEEAKAQIVDGDDLTPEQLAADANAFISNQNVA